MKKNIIYTCLVILSVTLFAQVSFSQIQDWKIKKTQWSVADEVAYSDFVAAIGAAVEKRECNSFQSCLKHKNNPYRGTDSNQLNVFADCAKLSFVMRGYFAWKNGLPFSIADGIGLRNISGNSGDPRYSTFGNSVSSRKSFLPIRAEDGSISYVNPIRTLNVTIPNSVYSANFRVHYEISDKTNLEADFYPVTVNRESIRAGTNIYDPNGHVAIVYKVTDDGQVYFIDAHPDNSLTFGLFGTKFVRSNPGQAAGFKNFRPLKLVGATYDNNVGTYVGGKIVAAKNSEISDFDLEQFFGTDRAPRSDWSRGPFNFEGQSVGYYEYLRLKLAVGNFKLDPIKEVKSLTEDLCQTTQDRVVAVQASARAGVMTKAHPERLPFNIYGTSGEWEEYSTPSRDARLKTTFKELRDLVQNMVQRFEQRDPRVDYTGVSIKQDMLDTYLAVSNSCDISYVNSNNQSVALSLDNVRERLFSLSFDPYHCTELRWGASSAEELASCKDGSTKKSWYQAEQWLRNQIERRYDARMDFSLEELLTGPKPGVGVLNPPDTDLVKYLTSP